MKGDRNQKIATLEYQRSQDALRMMNESMIVRDAEMLRQTRGSSWS